MPVWTIKSTAADRPAMPWPFSVPASSRVGYSRGCVSRYDCTPVPPTFSGSTSISPLMHSPPVPWGPIMDLCPVKHSSDTPDFAMSMGVAPAVWEASTMNRRPWALAI